MRVADGLDGSTDVVSFVYLTCALFGFGFLAKTQRRRRSKGRSRSLHFLFENAWGESCAIPKSYPIVLFVSRTLSVDVQRRLPSLLSFHAECSYGERRLDLCWHLGIVYNCLSICVT